MDQPWLRQAAKQQFKDPAPFLIRLRELEGDVARSNLPTRVKNLRTNELKEWREAREAALFCHGMGQRIGQTVYFARGESQDYDFIASWVVAGEQHLAPIQLKEVVPHSVNPQASLEAVIAGLAKYRSSKQLTVAIHLNRDTTFQPSKLQTSRLDLAAIWIFASTTADQSRWSLWGNFIEQPDVSYFEYPRG